MKQTIIYKLNPTGEQEKHLHNLCSIATKLYNTDNYIRRQEWDKTGKIPNAYTQKKLLRENVWFRLLPSQTAQEVSFTLQRNYCSWFTLRKKDDKARPPRFRKKEMLSPLTFYQQFKLTGNKIRFAMSRKYVFEHRIKSLEIEFIAWKEVKGIPKMCQVVFRKGKWYAHVVCDVPEVRPSLNDRIMAIDLGVINTAATTDTIGNSTIYSGKQILSIQHYFNKEKAKLQSKLTKQYPKRKWSRSLGILQSKQNRQIRQALHIHAKSIIDDCKRKSIKTVIVGDLTDIRKDKHWGKKESQKIHSWSFSTFTKGLEYKAVQAGIRFVKVNERYTSQKCSSCGIIRKSNRKHRGQYVCKCGNKLNADVNGSLNILNKYLQEQSRSIGKVALPSVARLKNVVPCEV